MLLDVLAPLSRSFAGKTVVDLGCGTGIVGISLAAAGARVWLTDVGVGVDIAAANAAANAKTISDGCGSVTCQELDWGDARARLDGVGEGASVHAIISCEVRILNTKP